MVKISLALSFLTLELVVYGEIYRGYPCHRKFNQLHCPSPGNNYPNRTKDGGETRQREMSLDREKIEVFIDENKALVKRMFGDYMFEGDEKDTPPVPLDQYEVHKRGKRARPSYSSSSNKLYDRCLRICSGNSHSLLGFQQCGENSCHRQYATSPAGHSAGSVPVSDYFEFISVVRK
ncbi:uncharacterized protein [Centruroides vittatus]|uniref:uncharacterized protein isoform X4 n=1 Tax=Centruroides vittatus TaxID=120091 RepID=UPI003510C0AF